MVEKIKNLFVITLWTMVGRPTLILPTVTSTA